MSKLIEKIEKIIAAIEAQQIGMATWLFSFLGVLGIREFVEGFVSGPERSFTEILVDYLHNCFFFGLSFFLIWLILSLVLGKNPKNIKNIIFWAFWLAILPPIVDMLKTGGQVYWSFYLISDIKALFSQFLTFFGHLPSGIVYFGTKIVFLVAIVFIFGFAYIKSKMWIKAFLSAFLVYVALFFMGSFPSWGAFVYYPIVFGKKISEVSSVDIIQLFGAPTKVFGVEFDNFKYSLAHNLNLVYFLLLTILLFFIFWLIDRKKVLAIIQNARIPQIVYHSGLFFIGLGLGYLAYPENLNISLFTIIGTLVLLVSIWMAWIDSVIFNDIQDLEIDRVSNSWRPLPKNIFSVAEYRELGSLFVFFSVLGGVLVSLKVAGLLLIYQFLAWAYSMRPYRLKKFPVVATAVSAIASLIILFLGFSLFSAEQNLHGLSWRIVALLFLALTLSLPIKDFKDIEGDRKEKIWTIPVLFGEEKGRLIVAVGVFISFVLSVAFLNEFRLFWWSIIFGAITFLLIMNKKINPTHFFWWVLLPVIGYGLILVKIVFLK